MTKYLPIFANLAFVIWLTVQAFADYQASRGWSLLFCIVFLIGAALVFGTYAGSITK